MRRGALRIILSGTLAWALIQAITPAVAEVLDHWEERGELTVVGEGWNARFRKEWDGAAARPGAEYSRRGQRVAFVPFDSEGALAERLTVCAVNRSEAATEAVLTFTVGEEPLELRLLIRDDGVLEVGGGDSVHGVSLRAPIEVGVLPGMRLEDVLYYPEDFPDANAIHVPSENWLAGLLSGNDGILACAWPEGDQALSLDMAGAPPERLIEGIRIDLAGHKLYAQVLADTGVWHREALALSYLEKDTKIAWQRPFDAVYKTQVPLKGETTVLRTHHVAGSRRQQWRPETGSAVLPVWFDGDDTWLHLGKRTPPQGDLVIYPFRDADSALLSFLRRTPLAEAIEKRGEGEGLPRGPRNAPNVGYNACWGTGLLRRTLYASGVHHREREFLREHTDFLADYVAVIQRRNAGYFEFIEKMRETVDGWLDQDRGPEVRAFLEEMSAHVDAIEAGHRQKMELYGDDTPEAHIAHADRNAVRLKELLETGGQELYPECEQLVDEFNRMSWAHNESTGMRFSMLTRAWAQEAARACGTNAAAVEYAAAIRAAIRDALRRAAQW